jgi:hypothetical protein
LNYSLKQSVPHTSDMVLYSDPSVPFLFRIGSLSSPVPFILIGKILYPSCGTVIISITLRSGEFSGLIFATIFEGTRAFLSCELLEPLGQKETYLHSVVTRS